MVVAQMGTVPFFPDISGRSVAMKNLRKFPNLGRWFFALAIADLLFWPLPAGADVGYLNQGSIVTWGDDTLCQRTGMDPYTPPADSVFTQVAAGMEHSLALKSNGFGIGWGFDFPPSYVPCEVPPENDFTQLACGSMFSIGLRNNGSIAAWGVNDNGQCNVPSSGIFTKIDAGTWHGVALRGDGSLVAWGGGEPGGDIDYGQCNVPAGNNFSQIACGVAHNLALKNDGTMVGWGYNWNGQADPLPGDQFVQVSCGKNHSAALRKDGSLVAWGKNNYGQCNAAVGNDFLKVDCGTDFTLALRQDGTIAAWGVNDKGQCNAPTSGLYLDIAAGDFHGVGLLARQSYEYLLVAGSGNQTLLQRDVLVTGNATIRAPLTARNHPTMTVLGCTIIDDGASLTIDNSWSLSSPQIFLGIGSTLAFARDGDEYGFDGDVRGDGALVKDGSAVLVLSGSNSYCGGTRVDAGSLIVADAGALPVGTNLTIVGSGTVVLSSEWTLAAASSGTPASVPEPATFVLLAAGAASLLAGMWRRIHTAGQASSGTQRCAKLRLQRDPANEP
jgi:autotransporter-associated beta strand protein